MATHKRTRTGCWTCREAGYKCDEQKPYCARCTRLNIICKGYGVKLKWQDGNISTPTKRPRPARRKGTTDHGSSSSPASTSTVSTPSTLASPQNYVKSPGSTYGLPVLHIASPGVATDLSSSDRWLLHYWAERLSTLISVVPRKDQTTPFQVHLTAMAYDSTALRSTILSMAANHLALSSNDSSLRIQAYRHQRDAIHSLQSALQDPTQAAAEPTLATVLMMQVSARLFGDEDEASVANHLAGAKAMITRRGHDQSSSTAKFLLSLFAYHDILSSVSRGAPPLLNHDDDFSAVEGEAELEKIAIILLSVARISHLQHSIKARRATQPNTTLSEAEDATARAIQHTLLTMDIITSPPPPSHENHNHHTAISLTAQAYRHAAFIYLYRTWLNIGAPNPISTTHVTQCLSHLAQIPYDSPLTSAHVWPLFTAGCEATSAPDREFVRARFEDMYRAKKFPSLRRVMRDVWEVWEAKDGEREEEGMAGVDCIQVILRRRGREVDLA